MEKVPTLDEVSIQIQNTISNIRLKNAQLAGVIEYLDAGYEPHVHHFCPDRAKFLDHLLLSLKDDLRDFEINMKEYVKLCASTLRVHKGGPHPSSKTDSGIGMPPPDTSNF